MGFRRSFSGWVGGVTVVFGLAFIALGIKAMEFTMPSGPNHAVGVPMWGGVFLVMTGMAVVAEVLGRNKRKLNYSFFKFPIVTLMANLITFIVACVIIAIMTWAMYDDYLESPSPIGLSADERGDGLSLYATVLFMAVILLMVSLFAMFIDCCASFLVVPNAGNDFHGPPPAVYDQRPAIIYK